MMLFDIIDETTHVQYADRWLPVLAEQAGCDNTGYRERAVKARAEKQQDELLRIEEAKKLPRTPDFAPWKRYQDLLEKIHRVSPFSSEFKSEWRSPKPM